MGGFSYGLAVFFLNLTHYMEVYVVQSIGLSMQLQGANIIQQHYCLIALTLLPSVYKA